MYFWKASNIAELYKGAESVTGPFAKHLIRQAGLLEPSEGPLIILDNACGTGIVTSELHDMLDEGAKERLQVTCGDLSEAMVHAVQQRIEAHEWKHVKAQLVNALV
jgi:ubiquinone/menaquinone biosynthesis C-methylase UbiE